MSKSGRKNKRYAKAFNPYELDKAFLNEKRKAAIRDEANEKLELVKSASAALRLKLKIAFWSWMFKTARHLAAQDIKTPHEVLISSNPNPTSTGFAAGGSGALAIAAKGLQLLLLPIQKGIQYWIWKNQPEPIKPERPEILKTKTLDEAMHDEKHKKEVAAYAQRFNKYQQDLRNKELLKPKFTRRDAAYLALDITMLALTIATFAVAAPYAAAAIAVAAACVSFAVATYHVAKFLYTTHKLKKDNIAIKNFLEDFDGKNNKDIMKFLKQQGYKHPPGSPLPSRDMARDYLQNRQEQIDTAIKVDKKNLYTKFRQTFGLGLTMMMVVGAGLMLGGVALGPYGAPLIAAGMALSITAGVIAFGMFVVNAIKNKRDHAKARTSTLPVEDADEDKDNDEVIKLDKTSTPSINETLANKEAEKALDDDMNPEELNAKLEEMCDLLDEINGLLTSLEGKLVTPAKPNTLLSESKATLHSQKPEQAVTEETELSSQPQNKLE